MKLLIVDDEIRTVKGIINCLNWEELGINEIKYVHNGVDALKTLEEYPADILLSDIKMPKMDGIELSQKLSQSYPHIRVVFITGYADINYMKSAFKSKVIDYILKPVSVPELREVITRVTGAIKAEALQNDYLKNLEAKLHISLPLLQEKFFIGLINNDFPHTETIENRLAFLRINLKEYAKYASFVIISDGFTEQDSSWGDPNLLSVAIINISQEILSDHTVGYCFEKSENYFVCILSVDHLGDCANLALDAELSIEDQLENIAREINHSLNKFLGISTTIGIGVWVDHLSEISASYESAQRAAARRLHLGKGQIILGGNTGIHQSPHTHIRFYNYNRIYTAVVNTDIAEATSIVNGIFTQINTIKESNLSNVLIVCNQIISAVNSGLVESIECGEQDILAMNGVLSALSSSVTLAEMQALVQNYITQTIQRIVSASITSQNSVIESVKSTIHKSYSEDISLRTLAKQVYLSPAYLCLLFKQETGQTLTNYITAVRIEKSKSLLKDTDRRIIDVCYEVGFNDSKYFSRIFKKFTNVTPSEYRQNPTD